MEVSQIKTNTLVDKISDPLYVYIGEGPILGTEDKPVWSITRVEKSTGNSKIGLRSQLEKDRELNKWTDRESLTY